MANNKPPIEDIFEETDKVSSGNVSRPAQQKPAVPKKQPASIPGSAPPSRRPPPTEIPPRQSLRKVILIVLAIVVIAGGVVILLGSDVFNSQDTSTQVEVVNDVNAIDTSSVDDEEILVELPTVVASTMIDTDGDGLSDEEEQQLGLDIQKQDTDSDGLFDWEEVKVYQTNPLKSDTDGDGNLDGTEVANGYNPKGPGLLLDLQAEISKLNN